MADDRKPERPVTAARDNAAPLEGVGRLVVTTLKRRREFERVRGGVRWSGAAFLIEAKARPPAEPVPGPRFGFTITKKLGGAVVRNRMRRRLKAALARLPATAARADLDHVIVARGSAVDMPFEQLVADLATALTAVARPPLVRPPKSPRRAGI